MDSQTLTLLTVLVVTMVSMVLLSVLLVRMGRLDRNVNALLYRLPMAAWPRPSAPPVQFYQV